MAFVRVKQAAYRDRSKQAAHGWDRRRGPKGERRNRRDVYYQLVETYRDGGKVRQRVLMHLGRYPDVEEALAAWTEEAEAQQGFQARRIARFAKEEASIRQLYASLTKLGLRPPPYLLPDGSIRPLTPGLLEPGRYRRRLAQYWRAKESVDRGEARTATLADRIARLQALCPVNAAGFDEALTRHRHQRAEAMAHFAQLDAVLRSRFGRSA